MAARLRISPSGAAFLCLSPHPLPNPPPHAGEGRVGAKRGGEVVASPRSPMTDHAADLVAEDLACRRGERLVFSSLSFRLPAGGALMLTGTNGSGKTSLLRLLATLSAPAAGTLS